MKNCLTARGERFRHEAQLDERFHPDREEKIKNLIAVKEGEEPFVVLADQGIHRMRKQAVETHIPEAEFAMRPRELRLPIGAESEGGVPAPEGVLPDVPKGRGFLRELADELRHMLCG